MIELSLNEVETLSMKVARGSGFSWGPAEDIGRAARSLAISGLPWADAIIALVTGADERGPPAVSTDTEVSGIVTAASDGRQLCPIRTAAWLVDADHLKNPGSLRLERVASPIWLAALTTLANIEQEKVFVWPGAEVTIFCDALAYTGGKLLTPQADVIVRSGQTFAMRPTPKRRAFIDRAALDALEAIAAKTYVPASESSRSTGAGGSRTDDE